MLGAAAITHRTDGEKEDVARTRAHMKGKLESLL